MQLHGNLDMFHLPAIISFDVAPTIEADRDRSPHGG